VILLIRPEVTIGITKFTDLLPLECVRVLLWRPNRLRPPSDADRRTWRENTTVASVIKRPVACSAGGMWAVPERAVSGDPRHHVVGMVHPLAALGTSAKRPGIASPARPK
jgi:hypothetical protein